MPKLYSPDNPTLAWCQVCTMWKPEHEIKSHDGVMECRPCREAREARTEAPKN